MIKTPVTYTIHDPNRFGFAVYKDANGILSPGQIANALNTAADKDRQIAVLSRQECVANLAKKGYTSAEIDIWLAGYDYANGGIRELS